MGSVNVFNKTEKPVTEHIKGVEITIPGRASASVSEKKAKELLDLRPEELSLSHLGDYGTSDFEAMKGLKKEDLQEACALLMRGQVVDFADFEETHAKVEGAGAGAAPATEPGAAPGTEPGAAPGTETKAKGK